MGMMRVMNSTGDTRVDIDSADPLSVAHANGLFAELTGHGYVAARRTGPGTQERVGALDPDAETILHAQLVGG